MTLEDKLDKYALAFENLRKVHEARFNEDLSYKRLAEIYGRTSEYTDYMKLLARYVEHGKDYNR